MDLCYISPFFSAVVIHFKVLPDGNLMGSTVVESYRLNWHYISKATYAEIICQVLIDLFSPFLSMNLCIYNRIPQVLDLASYTRMSPLQQAPIPNLTFYDMPHPFE